MSTRLAALLLVLAVVVAAAAAHYLLTVGDSSTEDEHVHMYTGALLAGRGSTTLNLEHPPLAKLIAGGALVAAGVSDPVPVELWQPAWIGNAVAHFVYNNRLPLPAMLVAARLPFLLLTLLLAAPVWLFTRRFAGDFAAVAAVTLTLFSPLLLAHGHLVHTDLIVTLFVTIAWLAGVAPLLGVRPPLRYLIVSGLAWGIALLSKYSAAILLVPFVALWTLPLRGVTPPGRDRIPLSTRLLLILVVAAVAFATLSAGMFVSWRSLDAQTAEMLSRFASPVSRPLLEIAPLRHLGVYALGVESFLARGSGVAVNYFAGSFSPDGWWYYFPAAFALKTPFSVLILLLIAAGTTTMRRDRLDLVLLLPAGFYLFVSFFSPYNIGLRHLLPIYPFLHVWIARLLSDRTAALPHGRTVRRTAAVLVVIALVEALAVWPHFIGYFNVLAGGRDTATFLLTDSNVDWGQDNRRLKELLEAKEMLPASVFLMGGSLPEVEIAPGVSPLDPTRAVAPGVYAVSRALFVSTTEFAKLPPEERSAYAFRHYPRFALPYGRFLVELAKEGKRVDTIGNSIDVWVVE